MEFALFYEIPVARPWQKDSERRAYKDTVEQAVPGEQAGCDVLFCLVNPYNIPHDRVMRSIELLGEHVIPALR